MTNNNSMFDEINLSEDEEISDEFLVEFENGLEEGEEVGDE